MPIEIPTFRGEWSGLWSEAKTQSPQISALARYAHDHTPAAETLWSTISATRGVPFPAGNTATLYDLMLTYDEHSGAGNTGWPQLNDRGKLEEQNRQYVGYMQQAKKETDFLLDQGMQLLAQPSRDEARSRCRRVTCGHCSFTTRFPGGEMISFQSTLRPIRSEDRGDSQGGQQSGNTLRC